MESRTLMLIGIISILGFLSGCTLGGGADYEIDGDSVFVNDSNIFLKATPHTIHYSDWVELEFESKLFGGDVDFAFGFDTTQVQPKEVQRFNPTDTQVNYTCAYDFIYTTNPNYFECYYEIAETGNSTAYNVTVFEHSFLGGNLGSKTAWWNETNNWTSFAGGFNSIDYDFDGKNKWYYRQGQNIVPGQTYKIRYLLDVGPNTNFAKYDIAIKPSDETIQEAIANDHFYFLDPWVDETLDPGLIAYFSFDDKDLDGTNVFDLGNYERNGTINGVLSTGNKGKLGQAFFYEADANKFVEIEPVDISPLIDDPTPAPGFTINYWLNMTDLAGENSVFGNANFDAVNNGWQHRTASGSTNLQYMAHHGGSWPDIVASTGVGFIDEDKWVMVTMSKNATDVLWYKNGSLWTSVSDSDGAADGAYDLRIGQSGTKSSMDGLVDELGFWNRSLTTTEIAALWNNGAGLSINPTPNSTTLTMEGITPSPAYTNATSLQCNFTAVTTSGLNFNATLNWSNGTYSVDVNYTEQTNGTSLAGNVTLPNFVKGNVWNCSVFAYQSDNISINATDSSLLTISNTIPLAPTTVTPVNDTYTPLGTQELACSGATDGDGETLTYNFLNASDNTTLQSSTATTYTWTLYNGTLNQWTCYVNDTTSNSSRTDILDLTQYYMNTCDNPTEVFINFTFQDEETLAVVNGTQAILVDDWYITGQTTTSDFSYTNTSEAGSRGLCVYPTDLSIETDIRFTYGGTDYENRVFQKDFTLTNTTTTQVLYQLNSASGGSYNFVTLDSQLRTLSGVDVKVERQISAVWTEILQGTTDDSGAVTFWLLPDQPYRLTFTKSGYSTQTITITPGAITDRNINMGGDVDVGGDYYDEYSGISWKIRPLPGILTYGTSYNFTLNISDSQSNLIGCNMTILNGTNEVYTTEACTGTPSANLSTEIEMNYSTLTGNYYYKTNDTTGYIKFVSYTWTTLNQTAESAGTIKAFLEQSAILFAVDGNTNEEQSSHAIWFFFFLVLGLGIVSFFSGLEVRHPMAIFFFVAFPITWANVVGLLPLNLAVDWSAKYGLSLIAWMITLAVSFRLVRRGGV